MFTHFTAVLIGAGRKLETILPIIGDISDITVKLSDA